MQTNIICICILYDTYPSRYQLINMHTWCSLSASSTVKSKQIFLLHVLSFYTATSEYSTTNFCCNYRWTGIDVVHNCILIQLVISGGICHWGHQTWLDSHRHFNSRGCCACGRETDHFSSDGAVHHQEDRWGGQARWLCRQRSHGRLPHPGGPSACWVPAPLVCLQREDDCRVGCTSRLKPSHPVWRLWRWWWFSLYGNDEFVDLTVVPSLQITYGNCAFMTAFVSCPIPLSCKSFNP